MERKRINRWIVILGLALPAALPAQVHQIGVLAGVTAPSAQVSIFSAFSNSGGTSVSAQVDYAWRFKTTRHGNSFLEVPVSRAAKASVEVGPREVKVHQSQIFFTPGLKYAINTRSRVIPYAAAGFGLGWFDRAQVETNAPSVEIGYGFQPAFGFGGGVEVRVSRLIAVRAEVRDFIALGSVGPSHRVVYRGGAGFRF
jgi:opacity protein-like surface antigen